jgi:glycosyltransferase involved in cell wall biosynthesis
VGRGSDGKLTKLGPDVVGLGWIKDPAEEIASWSAMIVPIRVGGGTRVKIAEAFARKCPVVATRIGAFGYDVRDGEEILLADRADQFAAACIRLLQDPQLGRILTERAHERFLREWTWDSFEGSVANAVRKCLAESDYSQLTSR